MKLQYINVTPDRQTDGRTDGRTLYDGIYRPCTHAWGGKRNILNTGSTSVIRFD